VPKKPTGRATEAEQRVVEAVRELRQVHSWSYEELAHRMTDAGCKIHPTGIYKTEKEGRRVTIEELVTYAEVFGTSPESLLQYGGEREPRTLEIWRDLLSAERIMAILRATQAAYDDLIRGVRLEVHRNNELKARVKERLDRSHASQRRELEQTADQMRVDISTPEKLERAIWDWNATPTMLACRDALKRSKR